MNNKFLFIFVVCFGNICIYANENYPLQRLDIRIRDPFIYPDPVTTMYYMYAQTANRQGGLGAGVGVEAYRSKDLNHWSEPELVCKKPEGFWGGNEIWAPEMHHIGDWYYLFVSFRSRP